MGQDMEWCSLRDARPLGLAGLIALLALPCDPSSAATKTSVLYAFTGGADGGNPTGGVILDTSGNLYGTTTNGSIVFRLSPPTAGKTVWTDTVLYDLGELPAQAPMASLTPFVDGSLLGTTYNGGACESGVVFDVTPPKPGKTKWTGTTVSAYDPNPGCGYPGILMTGSVIHSRSPAEKNIYGIGLLQDVQGSNGAVFSVSRINKVWTPTALHIFTGGPSDGGIALNDSAAGPLFLDSSGNLYGVTDGGGAHLGGTFFKLTRPSAGQTNWTESILYNFTTNFGDAYYPLGGLIADKAGNFYGLAGGGTSTSGTVYRLSPPSAGNAAWTETTLYSFGSNTSGQDGYSPTAGLVAGADGNLFGVTTQGGTANLGTVFELSPPTAGQTAWTERILLNFTGKNGSNPRGRLVFGANRVLYGTASSGGSNSGGVCSSNGCGVIFSVRP